MRTSAMGLAFGGLFVIGPIGRGAGAVSVAPSISRLLGAPAAPGRGRRSRGRGDVPAAGRRGRGRLRHQRLLQRRGPPGVGHPAGDAVLRADQCQPGRDRAPLQLLTGRQPAVPRVPEWRRARSASSGPSIRPSAARLGTTGGRRLSIASPTSSPGWKSRLTFRDRSPSPATRTRPSFKWAWPPGAAASRRSLRYTNTLDLFETDIAAVRQSHGPRLHARRVLALAAQDRAVPPGRGRLHPVPQRRQRRAIRKERTRSRTGSLAGLRGLVTPKLTATLSAGLRRRHLRQHAPGLSAANPAGMSNLLAQVNLSLHAGHLHHPGAGLLARVPGLARHRRLLRPRLRSGSPSPQQVGAFVLTGAARYEYRRYQGITRRPACESGAQRPRVHDVRPGRLLPAALALCRRRLLQPDQPFDRRTMRPRCRLSVSTTPNI